VAWTPDGQLFSCSDDKTIWKWTADGESVGKVTSFDNLFITNISWIPPVGKQVRQSCRSSCADLCLSPSLRLLTSLPQHVLMELIVSFHAQVAKKRRSKHTKAL
jgi:WD40 repeat protein